MSKVETETLLNKIFSILKESGLDYCVQNKYEQMPQEIPSDIDMFYRNASEKTLDRIMLVISEETGLLITQKIANGYYQFAYMFSFPVPESGFQLQLDFYPELSSASFPHAFVPDALMDKKRLYKGFFVPDYYDEIYYQVIRRIMKKDLSVAHLENIQYLLSQGDADVILSRLAIGFGRDLFAKIKPLIETGNLSCFYDNYDEFLSFLKQQCILNSSFKKTILLWWFKTARLVPLRIFNPCGISVAFVAPDGAGKSTLIAEIEDLCSGSFHGVEKRYFRPRLFKNPGSYHPTNPTAEIDDNPDPHGRPVNGVIKSLFRFFFYNVDFLLGYIAIVLPMKIRRKLVIFDRYYYDYYVDMRRYQYCLPKWLPKLFSFMIPVPDLVFVLDAPGQVLFDRKKELNVSELDRQRICFQDAASKLSNGFLINADQPIESVISDVVKILVRKKSEQTMRKFKK